MKKFKQYLLKLNIIVNLWCNKKFLVKRELPFIDLDSLNKPYNNNVTDISLLEIFLQLRFNTRSVNDT